MNIGAFLDENGRIASWPKKQDKKKNVLQYMSEKFECGRKYTEKEVNEIISAWHSFNDIFILRRGMVEMKFLSRTRDGSEYWVTDKYRYLIDEAKRAGIERFAVGAGIFNSDDEILVMRRKPGDFLPYKFEIPGGGVEEGETLVQTVSREVKEETSLDVERVISYSTCYEYGMGDKHYKEFSFLIKTKATEPIVLTEHDEYRWVKNADGLDLTDEMRYTVDSMISLYQKLKGDGKL